MQIPPEWISWPSSEESRYLSAAERRAARERHFQWWCDHLPRAEPLPERDVWELLVDEWMGIEPASDPRVDPEETEEEHAVVRERVLADLADRDAMALDQQDREAMAAQERRHLQLEQRKEAAKAAAVAEELARRKRDYDAAHPVQPGQGRLRLREEPREEEETLQQRDARLRIEARETPHEREQRERAEVERARRDMAEAAATRRHFEAASGPARQPERRIEILAPREPPGAPIDLSVGGGGGVQLAMSGIYLSRCHLICPWPQGLPARGTPAELRRASREEAYQKDCAHMQRMYRGYTPPRDAWEAYVDICQGIPSRFAARLAPVMAQRPPVLRPDIAAILSAFAFPAPIVHGLLNLPSRRLAQVSGPVGACSDKRG